MLLFLDIFKKMFDYILIFLGLLFKIQNNLNNKKIHCINYMITFHIPMQISHSPPSSWEIKT